jgi:hypothetical protein
MNIGHVVRWILFYYDLGISEEDRYVEGRRAIPRQVRYL